MVDLSTTYMGIPIRNPLILAAGATTEKPEMCAKAAKSGWAAVVLKTHTPKEVSQRYPNPKGIVRPTYALVDTATGSKWRPVVPKLSASRSRGGKKLGKIQPGTWGVCAVYLSIPEPYMPYTGDTNIYHSDDEQLQYVSKTKQLVKGTDCKVIASITALTEEGLAQECELINKSDADMVELNLGGITTGCIDPHTGKWVRDSAGIYPEIVENFTRFCVEHIKGRPVGVKLPPRGPVPVECALAVQKAGGKGINYSNTVLFRPVIPPLVIDPDTLTLGVDVPGWPLVGNSLDVMAVPFHCGTIARFRLNGVTIDISGCGAVRESSDVIRYLMAGATSVQACKVTMIEGVGIGVEFLDAIQSWMTRKGYKSIKEFQGIVVSKEKLAIDPTKFPPVETPQAGGGSAPLSEVVLDKKKCINCGWCEQCCFHLAIEIKDEKPVIDKKLCEVCGMCVNICSMNALSIAPRRIKK